MISDTRDKLHEAKYHLDRLQIIELHFDHRRWELQAFLVAGRSVTFYMQKEFSKFSDFDCWYQAKRDEWSKEVPDMMNYLNAQRVIITHTAPLRTFHKISVELWQDVKVFEKASIYLTGTSGSLRNQILYEVNPDCPKTGELNMVSGWYFEDLPQTDVLSVCRNYWQKLSSLVDECESKYLSKE